MTFALVLFYDKTDGRDVPAPELAALRDRVARIPSLVEGLIYTPAAARDTYVADGTPPPLGLQLHFDRLEHLEAACAASGPLSDLPTLLPSLGKTRAGVQAFWRRTWPVPEPNNDGGRRCSYVVHYSGPAEDMNAWLAYYVAGHPPIFQKFPGIRGIEILTRVDWISGLPLDKVDNMQRNRVVFDTPEALTTALTSPVRHELRADFHNFPPFEGDNFHYPMWTETVLPGAEA